MLGGAGNTVTLSNQLVGTSGNGQFVVTSLGGNNTADASGVTSTNAIIFNAGTGIDTFKGGAGNDAFVLSAVANLTSSDVMTGGTGVDTIWLNGSGTVAAGAFAGVTGMEALVTSAGGSNAGGGERAPRGARRGEVIADLQANPGSKAGDVATRVGINPNHAQTILGNLLKQGVVTKEGQQYTLVAG